MFLNIESQTLYRDLLKEYDGVEEVSCLNDGTKGEFSAHVARFQDVSNSNFRFIEVAIERTIAINEANPRKPGLR